MEELADNKHRKFLQLVRSLEANIGYYLDMKNGIEFTSDEADYYIGVINTQKQLLKEFDLK